MSTLEDIGIKNKQKIQQFNKKNIFTVKDLIEFLPKEKYDENADEQTNILSAYIDRRTETGIRADIAESVATVDFKSINCGSKMVIANCIDKDGNEVTIRWFNQMYIYEQYRLYAGSEMLVVGKVGLNYKIEGSNLVTISKVPASDKFSKEKLGDTIIDMREAENNGLVLDGAKQALFVGKLTNVREYFSQKDKKNMVAATFKLDSGNTLTLMRENTKALADSLRPLVNQAVLIIGYAETAYEMTNPDIFTAKIDEAKRIYPRYPKIPKMSEDYLKSAIEKALETEDAKKEILPDSVIANAKVVSLEDAYKYLHMPESVEQIELGRKRLMFNDMLYFSLHNKIAKRDNTISTNVKIKKKSELRKRIEDSLPFKLTADQESAVNEILNTMSSGTRVNAIVQGDVGCGKTIVAMLTIAALVENGYQCVLMAPTQVLAKQHYEDAKKLFDQFSIPVAFLSGERMKAAEKRKILAGIELGTIKVIIGTHTVFSEEVKYKKLGLIIIDEEHKFGVMQRASIIEKAKNGVHSITMSATPIPRSLARVIYEGSIDIYTIETMPSNRKKVITKHVKENKEIFDKIREEVKLGRQAYVVCPMIDESDCEAMANVLSVNQVYEIYNQELEKDGIRISKLTGKSTKQETEEALLQMKNGETDVLISTTVIEVGVNVPNATLMIVSNAERFGLSQLHQLRGRVGRGKYQSYCLLQSELKSDTAKFRIAKMCETTSGFEVAQADLSLRGPGNLVGTQQSGENKYINEIIRFEKKYETAQKYAQDILDMGEHCCPLIESVVEERKKLHRA